MFPNKSQGHTFLGQTINATCYEGIFWSYKNMMVLIKLLNGLIIKTKLCHKNVQII